MAVISKGDNQLLHLNGRTGWHLPQGPGGTYAGFHPPDSGAAIEELEKLRANGADYLLVPNTGFWWLEYYQEFTRHLDTAYLKVWSTKHCLLYQLSNSRRSPPGYATARLRCLLLPWKRRLGHRKGTLEAEELRVAVDSRIPESMLVGEGSAFYISGWCYHSAARLANLQVVANGRVHSLKAWGMPRLDVKAAQYPYLDTKGRSYRSGFWGFVPFDKVDRVLDAPVALRATLPDGAIRERTIGHVRLEPGKTCPTRTQTSPLRPLIAICMTTYNPPLELFQRQIDSVRHQSFPNWICLITDDGSRPDIFEKIERIIGNDSRFQIHRLQTGRGFYANFERCLSLVPAEAEFVALSDHDDFWHVDKLQSLLEAFDPGTSLVYSDMRIVDDRGKVISPTYWTTRPNNFTRFASLLIANTVTGGASMFRRDLLRILLPFPAPIGEAYHDHWIGVVALAVASIKYVDRPLYDYVQHTANVIGHYAPAAAMSLFPRDASLRHPWRGLRQGLQLWQRTYFADLLRLQLMAQTLELRCTDRIGAAKAAQLRRLGNLGESWSSLCWLAAKAIAARGKITETVGAERPLLGAALWRHAAEWSFISRLGSSLPSSAPAPVASQVTAPQSHSAVEMLRAKIAPLSLQRCSGVAPRLNLIIPTIDLNYFFGGYITKFNLARRLAEQGFQVRMVIVDHCDWRPARWREQLAKFTGLEHFFDRVEATYAYDRSVPLEVHPEDTFIATTWWTAHIAHQAAQALAGRPFLYLIQEYEPFTFAMGSLAALAGQSYEFPHFALFSTELLRTYFRENRIGVFLESLAAGEENSTAFQNALTDVGEITRQDLANRVRKRLLFYARPEQHAARNMFELGVLALTEAIEEGVFEDNWEFYGIGSVGSASNLPLARGRSLTMLRRENQQVYRDILRAHDLGLALMYTPHPSLVPVEMAAAGMIAVTNTCANKTAKVLREISPNLLAVHPSIGGVKRGLVHAVSRIHDYDGRVEGSRVKWARDWETAFNPQTVAKIRQFIAGSRKPAIPDYAPGESLRRNGKLERQEEAA